MPLITDTNTIIMDGTPFEISYNEDSTIDYVDYIVGDSIFRESYTYANGLLVSVSIPTKQV